MKLSSRTIDEILVIKVTGEMSWRGGVDALGAAVDDAVESDHEKILLELAPFNWDSYGFDELGRTLICIAENQGKAVCKLGPIPIRDIRWFTVLAPLAACFDRLDEALEYLKEDC